MVIGSGASPALAKGATRARASLGEWISKRPMIEFQKPRTVHGVPTSTQTIIRASTQLQPPLPATAAKASASTA